MAPRLAASQLVMIRDMISSKSLTISQIVEAAGCSKRSIITISANLRMFGDVHAPLIPGGRPRVVTPLMLKALCDHLLEKPDLYLEEMAEFLYNEFDVIASRYTISRADASMFEDFIEQLLHHCNRWPEPKSVLVMDNASFHHTDRIRELCSNAGVKLLYLPPYSDRRISRRTQSICETKMANTQIKTLKISLNGAWMSWGLEEKVQKVIFDMRTLRLKSSERSCTVHFRL